MTIQRCKLYDYDDEILNNYDIISFVNTSIIFALFRAWFDLYRLHGKIPRTAWATLVSNSFRFIKETHLTIYARDLAIYSDSVLHLSTWIEYSSWLTSICVIETSRNSLKFRQIFVAVLCYKMSDMKDYFNWKNVILAAGWATHK